MNESKGRMMQRLEITVFLLLLIGAWESTSIVNAQKASSSPCTDLLPGQSYCEHPEIDSKTQQPVDCAEDNTAPVTCYAIEGLDCDGLLENNTFIGQTPCVFTNGKDYRTAVALSVFLGWLGVDRFYLGYPAIGLFKMSTMGFFFIFHLVDIILITLQIVLPSDRSGYYIDYYGPRIASVTEYFNGTYYFANGSNEDRIIQLEISNWELDPVWLEVYEGLGHNKDNLIGLVHGSGGNESNSQIFVAFDQYVIIFFSHITLKLIQRNPNARAEGRNRFDATFLSKPCPSACRQISSNRCVKKCGCLFGVKMSNCTTVNTAAKETNSAAPATSKTDRQYYALTSSTTKLFIHGGWGMTGVSKTLSVYSLVGHEWTTSISSGTDERQQFPALFGHSAIITSKVHDNYQNKEILIVFGGLLPDRTFNDRIYSFSPSGQDGNWSSVHVADITGGFEKEQESKTTYNNNNSPKDLAFSAVVSRNETHHYVHGGVNVLDGSYSNRLFLLKILPSDFADSVVSPRYEWTELISSSQTSKGRRRRAGHQILFYEKMNSLIIFGGRRSFGFLSSESYDPTIPGIEMFNLDANDWLVLDEKTFISNAFINADVLVSLYGDRPTFFHLQCRKWSTAESDLSSNYAIFGQYRRKQILSLGLRNNQSKFVVLNANGDLGTLSKTISLPSWDEQKANTKNFCLNSENVVSSPWGVCSEKSECHFCHDERCIDLHLPCTGESYGGCSLCHEISDCSHCRSYSKSPFKCKWAGSRCQKSDVDSNDEGQECADEMKTDTSGLYLSYHLPNVVSSAVDQIVWDVPYSAKVIQSKSVSINFSFTSNLDAKVAEESRNGGAGDISKVKYGFKLMTYIPADWILTVMLVPPQPPNLNIHFYADNIEIGDKSGTFNQLTLLVNKSSQSQVLKIVGTLPMDIQFILAFNDMSNIKPTIYNTAASHDRQKVCSDHAQCLECTMIRSDCVWDGRTGKCMELKTAAGSNFAALTQQFIILKPSKCSDLCPEIQSCSECVQMGCEWYHWKTEGYGQAFCRRKGLMPWLPSYDITRKCPLECHEMKNCKRCVENGMECSWCRDGMQCQPSSILQYLYPPGSCPNPSTSYRKSDCNECPGNNCLECLSHHDCGWCSTAGDSYNGTCQPFRNNTCPTSSWNWWSCPLGNECSTDAHHKCLPEAVCEDRPQGYKCTCKPGYEGDGINRCDPTCYPSCDPNHGVCNKTSLQCHCSIGWGGRRCDQDCGCNLHSHCRDNGIGVCDKCEGNTKGDRCEQCADGYFGRPLNGGECRQCDCSGNGDVSKGICDKTSGVCFCVNHRRGDRCDVCQVGYFEYRGECASDCTGYFVAEVSPAAAAFYFGFHSPLRYSSRPDVVERKSLECRWHVAHNFPRPGRLEIQTISNHYPSNMITNNCHGDSNLIVRNGNKTYFMCQPRRTKRQAIFNGRVRFSGQSIVLDIDGLSQVDILYRGHSKWFGILSNTFPGVRLTNWTDISPTYDPTAGGQQKDCTRMGVSCGECRLQWNCMWCQSSPQGGRCTFVNDTTCAPKENRHLTSCPIENECASGNHNCDGESETCQDLVVGYKCVCSDGYEKDRSGSRCEPVCEGGCHNGGYCSSPNNCTCRLGFVGLKCEVECDCNGHSDCPGPDKRDECLSCDRNTTGKHCESCIKDYYHVEMVGSRCVRCPDLCNQKSDVCRNISSTWTTTKKRMYECINCRDNTEGQRCEHCLDGFYYRHPFGCTRCDCNARGGPTNYCNKQTGRNCVCTGNTRTPQTSSNAAKQCSECVKGFVGYVETARGHCYKEFNPNLDVCLNPRTHGLCIDELYDGGSDMETPEIRPNEILLIALKRTSTGDVRVILDIIHGTSVYLFFTLDPRRLHVDFKNGKGMESIKYESKSLSKSDADEAISNGQNCQNSADYGRTTVADGNLRQLYICRASYGRSTFVFPMQLFNSLPKSEPYTHLYLLMYNDQDSPVRGALIHYQEKVGVDLFVFFSVFFGGFFLILSVGDIIWTARRRWQELVAMNNANQELEAMAARPFASFPLSMDYPDIQELELRPCCTQFIAGTNNREAVATVLLRLPRITGGLAVGSTFATITKQSANALSSPVMNKFPVSFQPKRVHPSR